MEHTVDEIKEIIESDSDMAPRNKLNTVINKEALSFVQPVHKVIFPDRDNRYRNVVIDNEKESIYCFSADIDFGSSVLSE